MIKQLSSRVVYRNRWMTVREDEVEFPVGHRGIYGVVEKLNYALIVPLHEGSFYLVRQYRYPVQGSYWEFPQGAAEDGPSLSPLALARQELAEETGLHAERMESLGFLYVANGYCTQGFHLFVATELDQREQSLEATEQGMEVREVPIARFEEWVLQGEIRDAPTASAYALLKMKGYI